MAGWAGMLASGNGRSVFMHPYPISRHRLLPTDYRGPHFGDNAKNNMDDDDVAVFLVAALASASFVLQI